MRETQLLVHQCTFNACKSVTDATQPPTAGKLMPNTNTIVGRAIIIARRMFSLPAMSMLTSPALN